MLKKFEVALKLPSQNVVYASTTKGGMKVLYEGHYFKYVFKRYECGVFQCCYNENNEQCDARIIVNRNLVYPLDGGHNHFNQATDKSVTSVLIEGLDTGEDHSADDDANYKPITTHNLNMGGRDEFVVMEVKESVSDGSILPLQTISIHDENYQPTKSEILSPEHHVTDSQVLKKNADDLREKIKKRLQQALMKKKKSQQ
ncbi:modifier of mdg4 [Episyrphus balteatus]|uniref:modifier of mdg4 n=1 Tax=Episyrphus balteatus TaxID=286459 RepID=UPI002485CF3A|nr:modifier of mdg4 [Episyrphus balteatus]XP_055850830.1 modifier of mdg4 [Episyrphus balteatus]